MPNYPGLLLVLLAAAACTPAAPPLTRLQLVNDSQEALVDIAVFCDGQLLADTLVARYRTPTDRLHYYLRLPPGRHRVVARSRRQHTRLDTILNTSGHNVLGITFRYDSIAPRARPTYFADGSAGEITFPAFYLPRSFRLYQFHTTAPLRPAPTGELLSN